MDRVDRLTAMGVLNFEMEAATVMTLCSLFNLRGGAACVVIADRVRNEWRPEGADDVLAHLGATAAVVLGEQDALKRRAGKEYYFPSSARVALRRSRLWMIYLETSHKRDVIATLDTDGPPCRDDPWFGLGELADELEEAVVVPYDQIPGFPATTAIGHRGEMALGLLGGQPVAVMRGRHHFYEGYTMATDHISSARAACAGL